MRWRLQQDTRLPPGYFAPSNIAKDVCEGTLPPPGYLDYQSDEKSIWHRNRDRLRNDDQWAPGFLSCCSSDVSGTTTEQVRTCGFRRKSSSFDRAPKIRDSVLLNCFESFLVTLLSISSETWKKHSWAISGSIVFRDWVLLILSGASLETAASFRLFLNVAMLLKKKFC